VAVADRRSERPMTETPVRTHEQSIIIEATPEALYDLVSDITRTGEWSPVCTACWWDHAGEAGQVGVWFTGHNELPERCWETRSQIAAADRGREFARIVGGGFARWGFTIDPDGAATKPTEGWEFLPSGIAMFQRRSMATGRRQRSTSAPGRLTTGSPGRSRRSSGSPSLPEFH